MGDVFCHPTPGHLPAAVSLAVAWAFLSPASSQAQGAWEALLTIDPYPSPYYSDWDVNPNIGSLTVVNHGASAGDVRVVFNIIDRSNRIIASGRSEPQTVPVGAAAIFDSPYELAGTSSHDADIERIAERTGRLPEGAYTACAAATDLDGFILSEACAEFTILYPDPPLLLGPMDGAALDRQDEIFQWTPVQVPVQFQAQYVLRIAEVLEGQTPAEALGSNIPQFESFELFAPNLQYPLDARPFEVGKTYAWSVRAFDQNGYPLSANQGRSEIWTFEFVEDATLATTPPVGELALDVSFFDEAVDEIPELYAVLTEGSYEEILAHFLEDARDGRIMIPLPLPDVFPTDAGAGGGVDGTGAGAESVGGPSPEPVAQRLSSTSPRYPAAAAACGPFTVPNAHMGADSDSKSFAIRVTVPGAPIHSLLQCFGIDGWSLPPQQQEWSLLFAANARGGAAIAFKPALFDFIGGVDLTYAVFVFNLLSDFTLRSADLPPEMADFFGAHEVPVWGPGVIDMVLGVRRWKKRDRSGPGIFRLIGKNFFGVTDLGGTEVTLRGFLGHREKTYRAARFGGGTETMGRAGVKLRDNWFLLGSVPIPPPEPLPWADESRFEVEVGTQDSSVSRLGTFGPVDTQTRYRVQLRYVLGGFEEVKPWVGIPQDSALEFYTELKLQGTGSAVTLAKPDTAVSGTDTTVTRTRRDPTGVWARSQGSLTFGTTAQLNLFCGLVNLFDPKLTIGRADPGGTLRANPLKNLAASLASGFGIRGSRLGTANLQVTRKLAVSVDTTASAGREVARLRSRADSLRERYERADVDLTRTEGLTATVESRGDEEEIRRHHERVRVLAEGARTLRDRWQRAQRELERVAGKPRMGVKLTARLDQGASIGFLLGLGADWAGGQMSACPSL